MAKTELKPFTVQVLSPSTLGRGVDGYLAQEGDIGTAWLAVPDEDEKDDQGNVVNKAGEPICGDNFKILGSAEEMEVVPVGAPNGARPTGVPGVFMIPVGDNWQVWQEGDPSTEIARRSPEEFAANNPDAPTIAERLEEQGLSSDGGASNLVDPDKDGRPGGFVKKAEIVAQLDAMDPPVEYDPNANRTELADLLATEKAKRAA